MLLGRRRCSVTEYQYDTDGRIVRAVTIHDPEWTDDDRSWALAWRLNADLACGDCGGRLDETTDPDYPYFFEPRVSGKCFRCEAIEVFKASQRETQSRASRNLGKDGASIPLSFQGFGDRLTVDEVPVGGDADG